MNKYSQRLLNEWIKHESIITGLDFDDTIFPCRKDFTNCQAVIDLVKECIQQGAKVIINTASPKERHQFIIDYCEEVGIEFTCLNENIIFTFGDNRKVYANVYLDDRAGLDEVMTILSEALTNYKIIVNQTSLKET